MKRVLFPSGRRLLGARPGWWSAVAGLVLTLLLFLTSGASLQAQVWTSRASTADNTWNDIVYSAEKSLFVAVARTGTDRVMTSPDGITWTALTEPGGNRYSSVTYGQWSASVDNKVLTGNVATLTTSAAHNFSVGMSVTITGVDATFNGTYTITAVTSTTFSYAKTAGDVASAAVSPAGTASAGLFVSVGEDGSGSVATSPDGITWTARTSPDVGGAYNAIAYGNGVFVAAATTYNGSNGAMTSPDGINWTARTTPGGDWRGLTFANNLFVAVNPNFGGDRVMTSPDGITWTSRTAAAANRWYSVVYGNGLFVAVSISGSGNRVMTSPDGITWTSRTSAADNDWYDVTFGDGRFIAVAQSGTGNRVMTSTDGISWSTETSATDNNWRGVAFGAGRFVAVANTGTDDRVMTRESSETWPTAVEVSWVRAHSENRRVFVEWKTAWEVGSVGFDVERLDNGEWVRVNPHLIPALNSPMGGQYRVEDPGAPDRPGILYRLIEFEESGSVQRYGPFEVTHYPLASQLRIERTADGWKLVFAGESSVEYSIEATGDLEREPWGEVGRVRADEGGRLTWDIQPAREGLGMRFYRAVRP